MQPLVSLFYAATRIFLEITMKSSDVKSYW